MLITMKSVLFNQSTVVTILWVNARPTLEYKHKISNRCIRFYTAFHLAVGINVKGVVNSYQTEVLVR
jgi:hypothetical protein